MNLFRKIRREELYDYLSNLEDEELKDVFYTASIVLKERKNKARIYKEYLLMKKENKNEDFSRKR